MICYKNRSTPNAIGGQLIPPLVGPAFCAIMSILEALQGARNGSLSHRRSHGVERLARGRRAMKAMPKRDAKGGASDRHIR